MSKIPVKKIARGLERVFRPHALAELDDDYHVFVVSWHGRYVEHSHEADEFLYIIEGELEVEMGGKKHNVRQGEAILIPARELHRTVAQRRCLGMVVERKGLQTLNG